MTTKQVEEIIQFLTKYGLNDSHILHNKDIIAKDFVDRYNGLVKNDLLHSVSGSFLCGHDQHGYRKCHEQCTECKEQQKIDKIYCEDCGDWAGCDNEDCQYFKGNDR